MRRQAFIVILAALSLSALAAEPAPGTKPIAALLLDGQSAGPYHNWRLTTAVLKKELEETGRFRVTVATAPDSLEKFDTFKPRFADYQVIVSNYDAPDWPPDLRSELEQFIDRGGGLVVVHAADNSFPNWREFNQMIGVGGWRGRDQRWGPFWYFQDGKLVSDLAPGPAGSHGARVPFQVVSRAPAHPIMKGLPPTWMHNSDELYAGLRGPGKNMTVLATAHSDPANKGTGHDEPSLMVVNYGQGRIFHTAMGHDVSALSCVGFITTFQRGTEWAATARVSQKVPPSFPTADTVSFRIDVARMDPDFPSASGKEKSFPDSADAALDAMRKRAAELNVGGVAVVAYFEGDRIQSWSSKMLVVGRMKDDPSQSDRGANLLAIAYSKAAEMADTLANSGSHVRPAMTGEVGWSGGVIARGKSGYLIAAFSGGKSEEDVQISQAGVIQLQTGL